MTRTQAIVFDMDGVLIDSEALHAHAKRIAFAHAGVALTRADRPERCCHTVPLQEGGGYRKTTIRLNGRRGSEQYQSTNSSMA
jgi:beta-phosphoglucomutase-like phosphatase (HAD superfamily)